MTFGVLPEYQRRGIATGLLTELRARAAARYAHVSSLSNRLALNVQCTNRGALAFYERVGFRKERFMAQYYHLDPETESDLP